MAHRSLDGMRVICWSQWNSYEDVAVLFQREDIRQHMQKAIGHRLPHVILCDVSAMVRDSDGEETWRAPDLGARLAFAESIETGIPGDGGESSSELR